MAADTPIHVHADAADTAAAAFARRGESDEWAVSRCVTSHYRQQSDEENNRA